MQKHEAVQLSTSVSAGGSFCFLSIHCCICNSSFTETCYKLSRRHFSDENGFCPCSSAQLTQWSQSLKWNQLRIRTSEATI